MLYSDVEANSVLFVADDDTPSTTNSRLCELRIDYLIEDG